MAKAYRTDVIRSEKFQGEIGHLSRAGKPQTVHCPVAGCDRTYEMYGYTPESREENIATLLERLKREHPGHTSEVLAVNAFRKRPR